MAIDDEKNAAKKMPVRTDDWYWDGLGWLNVKFLKCMVYIHFTHIVTVLQYDIHGIEHEATEKNDNARNSFTGRFFSNVD